MSAGSKCQGLKSGWAEKR